MTEHPPIHSTVITNRIMTIVAINITPSGWRRHKLPFQKNKTDEEPRASHAPPPSAPPPVSDLIWVGRCVRLNGPALSSFRQHRSRFVSADC